MPNRIVERLLALIIYVITMTVLLMAVYHFLENWHFSDFNFFAGGALVFLVAVGWGYILTQLIFAPKKQLEDKLTTLSANIMHELNIPLSTIKANTSMLKRGVEDEKTLKRLGRIEDASVRLEKLYNELVYSIRKEMHTIEKERFSLPDLLKERVHVFEEQKRNPFILDIAAYEIEVDKIGFEQMIDNLLSNAMKYSSKQTPISLVLDEDILSIIDKGIGMSSTDLLQVYERYYQADENKEGTGIGLALVKSYCDEEGIDIQIHSQKDVGTEVRLNLVKVHI
jgi:signal transduction histidine kinase